MISTKHKNIFYNGILYLKGGDLTDELKGIKNVDIYDISEFFEEDFLKQKRLSTLVTSYPFFMVLHI